MELRHLRYFEAVARHCHVTRAAAELRIAQPALSKQVSQLEQELGVTLFDRVGRSVRLTEAGEALLPHARAVIAQVESAYSEMAERVGLKRGRTVIGAPPSVGMYLLPRALAAFSRTYPGIEIRLHEAGLQALPELLETGQIDIAIASLPINSDNPSFTVVPLFTEDLIIATSRTHPLANRERVAMTELRDERWLLPSKNYELREATLKACKQAGFTPHVVLEGCETSTLLRLVAADMGIALVPSLAVTEGCCEVAVLQISDQKIQRSIGLVWRHDRVGSPAARALRAFLAEYTAKAFAFRHAPADQQPNEVVTVTSEKVSEQEDRGKGNGYSRGRAAQFAP